VQRVLDGEFVQVELNLKLAQIPLIGGFDADPDKVVGACRPLTAFLDGDVGYLAAVAVGSRGDYRNVSTIMRQALVQFKLGSSRFV
jgi:hypothetical protein